MGIVYHKDIIVGLSNSFCLVCTCVKLLQSSTRSMTSFGMKFIVFLFFGMELASFNRYGRFWDSSKIKAALKERLPSTHAWGSHIAQLADLFNESTMAIQGNPAPTLLLLQDRNQQCNFTSDSIDGQNLWIGGLVCGVSKKPFKPCNFDSTSEYTMPRFCGVLDERPIGGGIHQWQGWHSQVTAWSGTLEEGGGMERIPHIHCTPTHQPLESAPWLMLLVHRH